MITKKQYCQLIIDEFKIKEKVNTISETDILSSSNLAVAMEYLGMIKDRDLLEYTVTRGGIALMYTGNGLDDVGILSVRELLELLPEEVKR